MTNVYTSVDHVNTPQPPMSFRPVTDEDRKKFNGTREEFGAIHFLFDPDAVVRFLTALNPTTDRFTFQTFDDSKMRKAARLAVIRHGTLQEHWSELCQLNARGIGIFVCINETDGKGRETDNVKRVRALFVDLDKAGPLPMFHVPPHIICESSRDKHHGYWLVKDCPLDQFEALQKRLAAHYESDPKVHDLPRVLRVPGFFHAKIEKDGTWEDLPFRSRLIEVNSHPVYTVDEIMVGIPPIEEKPKSNDAGEQSTNSSKPWTEAEEQKLRSALAAIPTDEKILKEKFKDSHEVFYNIGRALERLGWGEKGFAIWRDWCAQNAEEFDEKGLLTFWESFGRTRDNSKKKITVGTVYWYAKQFGWKPPVPNSALEDFRAYMPSHLYIYMPTRELWPGSSVNARIPAIKLLDKNGEQRKDEAGNPATMKASVWLDKNRAVEQMTWAPGLPELIADRVVDQGGWIAKDGVTVFNLFRPPTVPLGDATKAEPWIEHVRRVYPDEAKHIIKYLAQRVQRPHEKINHGLVLGGAPGIGKDTLLEPVKHAVGPWNFVEVAPQQVLGRFNSFVKAVILRMSEARDLGEMNRFALYEHMKAYLAAPPDVLRCDEKNLREHSVFNVMGVIITSNRKDSFYLPADDRRHFVAWTEITKEEFSDSYWREIWGWYQAGGYSHVAAYLATLDLSAFDPKAPPPKTAAFWEIVEANRAPENPEFADAIDKLGNPDVVTVDMIREKAASHEFLDWIDDRRNARQIHHRMGECGYVVVRNTGRQDGCWKIKDKRQTVYAKAELSIHDRHKAAKDFVDKQQEEWRRGHEAIKQGKEREQREMQERREKYESQLRETQARRAWQAQQEQGDKDGGG
jgi:RepB DNA-primase N-terminal domain/Family of unknown function (DUF5906)/Primase C terminal 2 (PriCT-2)